MASSGGYGCSHYKRNVKLVAPCCAKTYYCRFCHDEQEDHEIDRQKVILVECVVCGSKQKKKRTCVACMNQFGLYACLICNLYDNVDKKQFHCEKCGICRVGPKENFFHCSTCNYCLNKNISHVHQCVPDSSRRNCPVCSKYIHTSVAEVIILYCGHLLHKHCYNSLVAHQKVKLCPLCGENLRPI